MANKLTQENTNYMVSIKPHLGLRGAIMSPSFKNAIDVGYNSALRNFGKEIAKLNWSGMRDTTKVLFTTAVLYAGDDNYTNIYKDTDIYTHVGNLQNNINQVTNLFMYMGRGEGTSVRSLLESTNFDNFKKLFKSILGLALFVDDYNNDAKINKIWQGYLNQMGKIKPWKLSAGTVEKHVLPILEASLKTPYYNAFKKGFESTKKSNTKIYDKIIKETRKSYTNFEIDLGQGKTKQLILSKLWRDDKFKVDAQYTKSIPLYINILSFNNCDKFRFNAPQLDVEQLIVTNNVTEASELHKLINDAIQQSSDEIKKIIVALTIEKAISDLSKELKVEINRFDYSELDSLLNGSLITLTKDPFNIEITHRGTLCLDLNPKPRDNDIVKHFVDNNFVNLNEIKQELQRILQPLINIIHLIDKPPTQELTQNVPQGVKVTFEHYDYEKNDKLAVKCEKTGNTPIFYYNFMHSGSNDCTIYLYPEGIYELARQEKWKLQPIIQTLQEKIGKVTSQQEEPEGIVSDEDEQQL